MLAEEDKKEKVPIVTETRRVNFNISDDVYSELEDLAAAKGTSVAAVLRNAIALELWAQNEKRQGNQLLSGHGKNYREIVLR